MKNNDLDAQSATADATAGSIASDAASHVAPWKAVNHPYQGRFGDTLDDWGVEDAKGERIVEVYQSDGLDEPTLYPAQRRAHLIAAAPELLEACKEFVRKCDNGEARSLRSYKQMSAAIAKAEGRS